MLIDSCGGKLGHATGWATWQFLLYSYLFTKVGHAGGCTLGCIVLHLVQSQADLHIYMMHRFVGFQVWWWHFGRLPTFFEHEQVSR